MNKYVVSETNQHVMKLIQMGAHVTVVASQMVYVSFDISEDIKVSYVYNINKNNEYFLERIRPYPLPVRVFESADDICSIIKIDIEQFKNAAKSHNIHEFIKKNQDFHNIILMFEDLFLYYNTSKETFDQLSLDINDIYETIIKAKETSKRVYFGKEPDNLKK